MKLFVGLGNPGSKHAGHRHNVGFMAVDEIANRHTAGPWRSRFQGVASEVTLDGEKCLLLKPETYMNESGRSVGEAARFYKVPLEDIIVFHDELDLAPGKVKVKAGGGSAGHNGLKSLTAHLGNDYRRVRIGIGHPGSKDRVHSHVLRDFAKSDLTWLEPLLDAMAKAAPQLAANNDSSFMNEVALALAPDKPVKAKAAETKDNKPQGRSKAPSAQDLARAQSERNASRDTAATESNQNAQGPLAHMLDKWRKKSGQE